jgi:hypothetical protein
LAISTPFGGLKASAAELEVQITRTEPGGAVAAVERRRGVRSLVKRKGAMLFVPNCCS